MCRQRSARIRCTRVQQSPVDVSPMGCLPCEVRLSAHPPVSVSPSHGAANPPYMSLTTKEFPVPIVDLVCTTLPTVPAWPDHNVTQYTYMNTQKGTRATTPEVQHTEAAVYTICATQPPQCMCKPPTPPRSCHASGPVNSPLLTAAAAAAQAPGWPPTRPEAVPGSSVQLTN